jgi:hypothetical protein
VRSSVTEVVGELRGLSRAGLIRTDWTGKAYVCKVTLRPYCRQYRRDIGGFIRIR